MLDALGQRAEYSAVCQAKRLFAEVNRYLHAIGELRLLDGMIFSELRQVVRGSLAYLGPCAR